MMTRHDNDGSRLSHLFAIILFAFSVVATFVVLKLKILDEPNQRSSHDRPTLNRGYGDICDMRLRFCCLVRR